MFGWTTAQASLAFTLNLSLVPFAMIVAGRIQDSKGPKVVTLVGGIIFGLGIFLAGRIGSLSGLYLTYGVLGGIGIGTVYACTVGNTIKWFPDKRGLAGGLTAAGFGMGAVVFAPLAVTLIAGSGVLGTFSILGILFGIVIVVSSFFMAAPAAGWKPEGWTPKSGATQGSEDKTSTEMLKTPRFYILWAMYTIGCISGLMIVGHASPIAQEQIGLSPEVAAAVVSFLGIANSSGRVFWGFISDRIGRYNAFAAMFVVSAVCLIILNLASGLALFIVGICGVAMSFGGYMGIMPSITADNFGAKYIGINYGVMFTAFGLAAFIGPRLAAVVKESSGGAYGPAFVITSVMSIAGILLALYVKRSLKKAQA
jgi:OFA family oxalate/formate antiporter-like MFS transporter